MKLHGNITKNAKFKRFLSVTLALCMVLTSGSAQATAGAAEASGENHQHTDGCYEKRIVCDMGEHEHTDACYENVLTCGYEESGLMPLSVSGGNGASDQIPDGGEGSEGSGNDGSAANGEGSENSGSAANGEGSENSGSAANGEGAENSESVANGENTENTENTENGEGGEAGALPFEGYDAAHWALTCGFGEEGHIHTKECYNEIYCGTAAHIHGAECRNENGENVCGMAEHTHDAACFISPQGQEGEEDFSGLMSLDELTALPDSVAKSTMWRSRLAMAPYDLDGAEENPEDGEQEKLPWNFSVYYVNQNGVRYDGQQDAYHTEDKSSNFSLKYQMEFHTEANIAAKMIEIRIPKALFKYRGAGGDISKPVGDPVELSTTGVPKVNNKDEKKDSNTTPFNYYVEGDYLVFFNYKEINAGTNAAWQVLYKDVQIMDAVDGSSWDLSARVEVTYTKETEDSEGNKTSEEVTVSQESSRLCGRIDTGVYLEYAVKSVHTEPDKLYAPGLYTQSQVELFIGDEKTNDIGGEDPADNAKLPAKYAEHMADWKFVVWEVAIRGSATQPWSLELLESPVAYVRNPGVDNPDVSDAYVAIPGEVVGYLNHTVEGTEYNLNINQGAEFKKTVIDGEEIYKATVLSDHMWSSWGNRFYIVTAYPAKYEKDGETLEIKEGDRLENNLEVRLVPVDSPSEKTRREWISDSWEYEKYDWVYSGDIIKSTKISNPAATGDERKTKVYNSWLEAYEKAKGKQKDYGDIYFSSTGAINGYGYAHIAPTRTPEGLIIGNENDETVGSYIEGNWYQMVAADDLLYAYPNGSNPVWLTGKDYYFSNITITQTDRGYDVSEDRMLPGPEFAGGVSDKIHIDGVKGGLVIQAVYSTETGGENNWEDAAYVEWDPSGNMVYSGALEKDGRRPWRVRVIHNTLEYSTKCQIEVNVCLRHDSPVMEEMLEERRTDEDFYLQLKNYSAATGASFTGNDSSKPSVIGISEGSRDYDQNYVGNDMISGLGLEEKTKATYKALYSQEEGEIVLPDRDYADATLHGLQKTAAASKTAYLTNDADHSRVLVNYRLTAYDGYFVNDQATADYLKRMDVPSPGKQYVMFYDLLPHGVTFDPSVGIIAGRITDLDSNEYYKFRPDKWNTSKVNVSVDTATDVIENWNGTGRMMVIFHLSYDGDPAVYTNGRWIEGWGLSFGAYYDWKDVKAVQNESNISAFMPDIAKYGEEIPALIGPANTVYADDGSVVRDQSRGDWAAYRDFYPNDSHNPINSLNTDGSKQNVLYASCSINEDNTESSYMGIKMSVRADADIYGIYGDSAYVQASKGYTYETTLTADAGGMKDIVIFDHLENAGAERGNEIDKDPNWGKFGNSWTGTLLGVDLSDLNGQKVEPEVWYNADRNAETTYWAKVDGTLVKRESELTPDKVLVPDASGSWDKGWYKAEDYIKKYIEAHKDDENFKELSAAQQRAQAVASVGSVAVDLRNSSEKDANGDPLEFQLHANEKVTFKLKMRAPEWSGELANKNAFNNPSYHATKIDGTLGGPLMRVGNSVRVGIGVQSDLEIWKTITNEDEVPSALVGKTFTFTLYREDEDGKELIIANREFVLKEWDADAKAWVKVEADVPHATLADGTFTLQAGQKAVFEKMPMAEAGSVKAREDADVYWFVDDSNVTETALADGTFTVTREMRNTYHPVLYLQKDWTGVPQNMTEEETKGLASTDFAFQLTLDGQPAAGVEYCYVNKAALNGGDVNIVSGTVKPDADGRLFTDADGRFTIRKGEIIALFIPEADTDYQLTELGASKGDVDTSADWIIDSSKAAASGTVPQGGAKALVKNCYRWRDLYLSKTVINKNTPDNTVSFTFKITDQNGNPVTGKSWQLLEADKTPVAGYENVKIDPEGRITAPCAGRIIRIEGLEAGSTYHVTEVELPSLYVPVKASQDVWMPTEAASQSVTFVNDYQMRSLSVTKTVVAAEVVDKAFEMVIAKKGANGSYTYGPFTYQVDGGAAQQTAADGRFSLKNGQTAEFKEIGMVGETFYVWEVADENYPQLYPITENPADLAVGSSSFKVGAPAEAVLGQSGSVKFINGTPGALMLSKEYMGAQGDTPEQTAENQGIADAIKERISRQRQAQLYEDEIKLCQWVEGNLDEIHAIGQRMNELAVQGTNGTITAGDRVSILKEIFQLKEESLRVLGEIGKVDHSWGGEIGAIQAGVQDICSDLNRDEIFSDEAANNEEANWNTEAWWQELIEQIQVLIEITSEARYIIGCYQDQKGSQIENLRIEWYQKAFDVTVHLTVNGMDWTPTQSDVITCIDQLKGQIYQIKYDSDNRRWQMVFQSKYGELVNWDAVNGLGEQEIFGWTEDGDFRIEPYMIYVIMLPSEDAEYAVTEVDCNGGDVPSLEGFERNYLIQQKVPSPGESIGGVVKESPEAVILNETSLIRGSLVEKRMTPDSDPVPEGSKLVWKVERYDAGARKWYPAEEIAYVINRNDEIVSPETEYTGSDGIIELSRGNYNEDFLAVQFLNDRVYLNRETGEDGTLRVVEVLKDSDPKWGMLVGYGVANDWEEGYGNASYETASAFVNSNLTAPVEVEKYVEDGESKEFTMILEQRQMDLATNRATYLPYEGVSYIVYSKATHEEEGRGHTNAKGHIKLHDGQYAVLELSTEAVWSMREDLSGRPDYRLASIVPESDPKNVLEAIDTTRALIDRRPDPEEGYILTRYDVQNGVCDAETNELTVLKEGTVVIPDRIVKDGIIYTVKGIGMGAFEGCEALKEITIPAAVSYVGPGAFYECTALEKVDFKAGDAEITIGNSAFYSCTKLDMALPDRVVSIGYQAFARTGLKRLVIPEKVQYLEEGAFAECTDLRYAEIHGSFGEIRKSMFDGCDKIEELVIDVENIGAEAFSSLQKYFYYDGNRNEMVEVITSIHGCDSLRKLTLTDKVKTIGDFAFASCQNLVEVVGGGSVHSIGKSAFVSCGILSRFDMGESLRSIGESAFAGCPINQITLPDTLEIIGAGAFAGCTELESIAIPDSVVRIGQDAFSGCGKLTSVTLGAGLKTIEAAAFMECGSLEEVTIPGGVQQIGEYAFAGCTSLQRATIEEGITMIGIGMFQGCSALETVTLPSTLETICEYAFWGCCSLWEVRIPENVNYIGEKAFYECESLTDVYLQQPYIQIGYWAFGAKDPENRWDINHRVCFHVNWSEGDYPEWPYHRWGYNENNQWDVLDRYTDVWVTWPDGSSGWASHAPWGAADEYVDESEQLRTVLRIVYTDSDGSSGETNP